MPVAKAESVSETAEAKEGGRETVAVAEVSVVSAGADDAEERK